MGDSFDPLNNIWKIYTESLDTAVADGWISDPEIAENYIWPGDLHIGPAEQEDIKRFVHERVTEVVSRIKKDGGVNIDFVAGYLFRTVLCAMMLERERFGR